MFKLNLLTILFLEKEPVFPFSMLSAKQGNYWYHFTLQLLLHDFSILFMYKLLSITNIIILHIINTSQDSHYKKSVESLSFEYKED